MAASWPKHQEPCWQVCMHLKKWLEEMAFLCVSLPNAPIADMAALLIRPLLAEFPLNLTLYFCGCRHIKRESDLKKSSAQLQRRGSVEYELDIPATIPQVSYKL